MKVTVQVVTITDDGQESIRELACIEREELTAESLGLSVAESKSLLQSLQEVVVEWQMKTYLDAQRHCPDCGKLRHSKGSHHSAFRTLFGTISVESPRLEQCRIPWVFCISPNRYISGMTGFLGSTPRRCRTTPATSILGASRKHRHAVLGMTVHGHVRSARRQYLLDDPTHLLGSKRLFEPCIVDLVEKGLRLWTQHISRQKDDP